MAIAKARAMMREAQKLVDAEEQARAVIRLSGQISKDGMTVKIEHRDAHGSITFHSNVLKAGPYADGCADILISGQPVNVSAMTETAEEQDSMQNRELSKLEYEAKKLELEARIKRGKEANWSD